MAKKASAEETFKLIHRHYSAAGKIRIVVAGMRGEDTIAERCSSEWPMDRRIFSSHWLDKPYN